jgi:hypothetical protein
LFHFVSLFFFVLFLFFLLRCCCWFIWTNFSFNLLLQMRVWIGETRGKRNLFYFIVHASLNLPRHRYRSKRKLETNRWNHEQPSQPNY